MRIAMAQVDPVVGGVTANRAMIEQCVDRADASGAALVVFPELTLTGYPLLDLTYRRALLDRQREALHVVAARTGGRDVTAVVGFIDEDRARLEGSDGRPVLYNAAAVLGGGEVRAVYRKILLPEYDVFFEKRYFTPGVEPLVVEVGGVRVGVEICEDLWDDRYEVKVTKGLVAAGAEVIVNLSASPYYVGKGRIRRELVERHVRENGRPIVYVNQVGTEDGYEGELIFDGESLAYDGAGRLIGRGPMFQEDLVLVDVDPATGRGAPIDDREFDLDAEAYRALVSGVRDYARRAGFTRALLGLSGGIDSALVAAIAVDALGPDQVLGVSMPSRYSSEHSKEDAIALAEDLGMELRTIPIDGIFQAYLDTLAPSFAGLAPDVTEENLQARARGGVLMALSNKTGALLLSTGNKTELALGYCTLYGDMNGGLMVLADVSKERVYALARKVNELAGRERIPARSIEKPPSAELREEQVDPFDYAVVSPLTELLVEEELEVDECVAKGYDRALVERLAGLIRRAEYKRRQAAPGFRITRKAFGVGRRLPNSYPAE